MSSSDRYAFKCIHSKIPQMFCNGLVFLLYLNYSNCRKSKHFVYWLYDLQRFFHCIKVSVIEVSIYNWSKFLFWICL